MLRFALLFVTSTALHATAKAGPASACKALKTGSLDASDLVEKCAFVADEMLWWHEDYAKFTKKCPSESALFLPRDDYLKCIRRTTRACEAAAAANKNAKALQANGNVIAEACEDMASRFSSGEIGRPAAPWRELCSNQTQIGGVWAPSDSRKVVGGKKIEGGLFYPWLSEASRDCIILHNSEMFLQRHLDRQAFNPAIKIQTYDAHRVYLDLKPFQAGANRACEQISALGAVRCERFVKGGTYGILTNINVPVHEEGRVTKRLRKLPVEGLQPYVDACKEIDPKAKSQGEGSPLPPWALFCDNIESLMSAGETARSTTQSTCIKDPDCNGALEALADNPDVYSVAQCLLGDASLPGEVCDEDYWNPNYRWSEQHCPGYGSEGALVPYCIRARQVLGDATEWYSESNNDLAVLLPLFQSPRLKSELPFDEKMLETCIVGGGRFISESIEACEKLRRRLKILQGTTLQLGCKQGNLAVCREWIKRSKSIHHRSGLESPGPMPLTLQVQTLRDSCDESQQWCRNYVDSIPTEHQCFNSQYNVKTRQVEWTDASWAPLIPKIKADMTALCADHPDEGVARTACTIESQAASGEGLFNSRCPQLRAERQIRLEEQARARDRCLNGNSSWISEHYADCAGIHFGTGSAQDQACQQQAENLACN